MFPIAGQTAGPNGLKFFCGHSWVAGGCLRLKGSNFVVFKKKKKFSRATPGPLASFYFVIG